MTTTTSDSAQITEAAAHSGRVRSKKKNGKSGKTGCMALTVGRLVGLTPGENERLKENENLISRN